ncbi:MAG: TIR domain-containing protein [Sphingomicrobium sp.]
MSDVFVSYKAEDRRRVRPLVEALNADGYSVWWDEQIGGGAAWRQAIEAELNAAKCVIVAWSKRSVGPEGTFVQDEATRAQQRRVYVPVTIDKVHVPLGFGEMQALSLTGWRGDRSDPRYQAVLSAVRRIAGGNAVKAVVHRVAHSPVSRRAVLSGSAVAAAAAAGVGGWMLLKPNAAAASDTIAVLPFANLSGDPEQAYFSDGIAEELRSALARLAGLKVVGRTSSEAVRDKDAKTAARELGVPNVLTGSVRRSPDTIRVSAQLIDDTSGMERWSESYDRPPGDTIKIQTDIAENVARALKVALGSAGKAALTLGGTHSPQAQNLLLEADASSDQFSRKGLERSIALVDAAIALDPNYAQAYALKAILLLALFNAFSREPDELARGRAEALGYANKAIGIAPNLPIAHGALAGIYQSNLEIRQAYAEYERVFALQKGDADALRSYGSFLSKMGDYSRAIKLANEAVALDPLNPDSYRTRGWILYNSRRYIEALKSLEELKRTPRQFSGGEFPVLRGTNLMMLGRTDEARKAYAQAQKDDPFRLAGEAALAARTGDRSTALKTMDGLQRLYGDPASYQYAQIHAQLGNMDQAFAALERARQIKDAGLLSAKTDPVLDPLRRDPRFAGLLDKIGFPA